MQRRMELKSHREDAPFDFGNRGLQSVWIGIIAVDWILEIGRMILWQKKNR